MPTNWSRRYKNHVEKLKSGDIYQVAEVVRNLSNRDKDKGLSAGEKRMLNRARQILVSELTFAIGVERGRGREEAGRRPPADRPVRAQRGVRCRPVEAWAVVVAGGSGTRFGAPKQFADLAVGRWRPGRWTRPGRCATAWSWSFPPALAGRGPWDAESVVAGGATRSESVRAGLAAVPTGAEIVAVHDAARPLARPGAVGGGPRRRRRQAPTAPVPAAPVTDTVKEVGADGRLVTLDRSRLVAVQTPQAFRAEVLRRAHAGRRPTRPTTPPWSKAAGGRVVLVDGPADNLKVTSPLDLVVAAALASVDAGR